MLRRQERINEERIPLTVYESDVTGHPRKAFLAWRDSLSGAAALLGQELPFELGRRHISSFSDLARPAFAGESPLTFAFESHDGAALVLDTWLIQIILGEELDETGGDGGGIPARQVVARTRYRHRVDFWNPLLQ